MSDFKEAFDLGQLRSQYDSIGGHPYIVLRRDDGGEAVESLERLLDRPLRKTGSVALQDERSLVIYAQHHKRPGTVLFADRDRRVVIAVFDHHLPEVTAQTVSTLAGWSGHRAVLTLERDREWAKWRSRDRRGTGQRDFVEFIEDQMPDVLRPDAADLLEVCSKLKGMRKIEFTGGVTLSSGDIQLAYVEETQAASSARGQLTVPERLTLKLPIFRGDAPREVSARLRWRLDEGKVQFTVVLDRPDQIEDLAMEEIVQRLKGTTGIELLSGTLAP